MNSFQILLHRTLKCMGHQEKCKCGFESIATALKN